jgi:hypothetical protein
MSRKSEDKYLGQIIHEDGLAASVAATVASRTGRFKGAVFEVRSVIEEFRNDGGQNITRKSPPPIAALREL